MNTKFKIITISSVLFIMLSLYNQQYALNLILLVMAAFLSTVMGLVYYGSFAYGVVKTWQLFVGVLKKLYYWHKGAKGRLEQKLLASATRAYRHQ
ncbi:MAG: hypothetical protein WCF94_04190 [bacterium]